MEFKALVRYLICEIIAGCHKEVLGSQVNAGEGPGMLLQEAGPENMIFGYWCLQEKINDSRGGDLMKGVGTQGDDRETRLQENWLWDSQNSHRDTERNYS